MAEDFEAIISGGSDRAEIWQRILGTDRVKIKSPLPTYATLPGMPDTLIYEMDIDLLSLEQRNRLVIHLSETFDIPQVDVDAGLNEVGCPILAEDVTVTIHNPQRWF